jgi:hypothetical protein
MRPRCPFLIRSTPAILALALSLASAPAAEILIPADAQDLIPPPPAREPGRNVPREASRPPTNTHFLTDIPGPRDLRPLIGNLHSLQYAAREEAYQVLLHLPSDRLSDIREALAHESDAEAAARLTRIAMHLFLKGQTPLQGRSSLLGIKFHPEIVRLDPKKPDDFRLTITIAELQLGYPAAQDLRVGDRLIAIDGKLFPLEMAEDDFRSAIINRRPGSIVRFTVVRQGQQLEIPVELAGLPDEGIEVAIERRNASLEAFAQSLQTAVASKPLILPDPSGFVPDNGLRIENGVIYRNGEILVIPAPR